MITHRKLLKSNAWICSLRKFIFYQLYIDMKQICMNGLNDVKYDHVQYIHYFFQFNMSMCRSEFHATVYEVRRNFIEHVLNRKTPGQYNDV